MYVSLPHKRYCFINESLRDNMDKAVRVVVAAPLLVQVVGLLLISGPMQARNSSIWCPENELRVPVGFEPTLS